MTTLKQLCNNDPAVAIEAMIDGLMRHREIKNFRLDFNHCGEWQDDVCFGGAATLALIELLEMSFAPPELGSSASRAELMGTNMLDLFKFEDAIKQFSTGNLKAIKQYFDLPTSISVRHSWNLENDNWETEILKVIAFHEQLTGQAYEYSKRPLVERFDTAEMASMLPPPTAIDCLESLVAQGWSRDEAMWQVSSQFGIDRSKLIANRDS